MKLKPSKRVPVLVACGVIAVVVLLRCLNLALLERMERITYDMRVRAALRLPSQVDTNLGFVFIDEHRVKRVADGSLGFRFGLYWPRQVYGRVVQELAYQGADAVAFDIIFGELRPDHAQVAMREGGFMESDDFFAMQMRRSGNVVIAQTPQVTPPDLFLTNAFAAGDIGADKDSDGILRRAPAFREYRRWHPAFRQMEADPDYGVDLHEFRMEPHRLVLIRHGVENINIPLDAVGYFDLADFWGGKLPPGIAPKAKPFTVRRVWHMGLVLAARALKLDLAKAEVDLPHGRITLRRPRGLQRVIPVDSKGYFYIDWSLPDSHPLLTKQPIEELLAQYRRRLHGDTNDLVNLWRNKLALVASSGVVGNNLTDRGATPLADDTLLASEHWNVANSLLTGRFVQRASLPMDIGSIVVLGAISAIATWRLRVLVATLLVLGLIGAYVALAFAVYFQSRYWLPLVLPLGGAVLVMHICVVTWRVVFEQAEQRRVRSFFSTLVSPKIVQELLRSETLSLGGARREITILFADVRGFTELTDASQERVAEQVKQQRLTGAAAETCFDAQARETLATINLYLGLVADTIIQHDGTLDKFIGDCVMAFWGAPTANASHAVACVRAAIAAQRAIYDLNRQRAAENQHREAENKERLAAGLSPEPLLPLLFLGTGINTGSATVGIMGAGAQAGVRQGNYTVFGRDVNLASRLEGASGRGRIFISQSTFEHLRNREPALAAACVCLPPIQVKGFRTPIQAYEVPWRGADAPTLEVEFGVAPASDTSTYFKRSQAPNPNLAESPIIPGESQ